MRMYKNVLYISVSDFKALRHLLKTWNLSKTDLFKEFELLSLSGFRNNDVIIYDWNKGTVRITRRSL